MVNVTHFVLLVCSFKVSQQQIEQSIKEMLEQKNKLAYDKGKLESKVEQLQREMENLASAQVDLSQLRKLQNSTEAKLNKVCVLQAKLNKSQFSSKLVL